MAEISARASGKLMMAGEYAVLFEPGRCLAMAVGDVAWATWQSDSDATLTLDAFDQVRSWPLQAIPTEQLMGFIQAALDEAGQGNLPDGGLHLRVAGQLKGRKFGLGSSAATTIATLRATLSGLQKDISATALVALAKGVHRSQQGGQGSGYDIVTIAHGGCVAYERSTGAVQQLTWPNGLFGAALYTGTPSSTVSALRHGIDASTAGIDAIAAASDILLTRWNTGDVGLILQAFLACEAAFETLAQDHTWMNPPSLVALKAHITSHGGVARTSGAGGGDCVLAWTDSKTTRDAIIAGWAEQCVARLPEDLGAVETP